MHFLIEVNCVASIRQILIEEAKGDIQGTSVLVIGAACLREALDVGMTKSLPGATRFKK